MEGNGLKHSEKFRARALFDAVEAYGIQDVVISPGSRNAPLIIEAESRPQFTRHVITDERSAAFTALGMASASEKPVMLVCTSGSAVLNYHPAVAEAFYAKIPLIVVSADRPTYRIDKGEGQTIRQHEVLKNHTFVSVTLSEEVNKPELLQAQLEKTFRAALEHKGPVHINIPFEEPLYGFVSGHEKLKFSPYEEKDLPVADETLDRLESIWKKARRKLILVSQMPLSERPLEQLERLVQFGDTVILTENIANVNGKDYLSHTDRLIFPLTASEWKELAPDLVITVGRNIISKKIKFLLREQKPALGHWHVEKTTLPPDTFDVLSEHINTSPGMCFSQLLFRIYDYEPPTSYASLWKELARRREEKHKAFLKNPDFGDLKFYEILSQILPQDWQVEWANSTVVRYAQLFPFRPEILHYANRGTSGIDGSVSTAVGRAKKSGRPTLLVTGDLSMLYDSNGLWQEIPENLKIIVINNGGGDIFRFIPGPSEVSAYEKYFVARHGKNFEYLGRFYGLKYTSLKTRLPREAREKLETFLHSDLQMLEIDTSETENARLLRAYFSSLK